MRRIVAALLLVLFPSINSNAALRITFDGGGRLSDYIEKYTMLRDAEAKVVIDGACISACTLITAFLDDGQACVTQRARLVFHSASLLTGEHSKEGTRLLWNLYPPKVRAVLVARGWNGDAEENAHPDLIYVEGEELRTIYSDCPTA